MRDLISQDDLDTLLREPRAVLLKHGAHCPISAAARKELDALAADAFATPIYRVEVTGERALSDRLAEQLGVAHESPQVMILEGGRPTWRAEHYDITADGIRRELGA